MLRNSQAWDFFRSIGAPTRFVAPMVDQSELPYRLLCRQYGADICYTPMFNSKVFVENETYRKTVWKTCPQERPVFVQFAGHDPDILLQASKLVEDSCDAVDLNLGCPQNIARRGRYGSFLLTETDLLVKIVSTLSSNLKIPVTCKIRLLPNLKDTLHLCLELQRAGCKLLTVHGRTKEQNKQAVGPCDWEAIRFLKNRLAIPVVANGGIGCATDVKRCLTFTGCDGVMTSEAILECPGLFSSNKHLPSGREVSRLGIAWQYVQLFEAFWNGTEKTARAHLFKLLFPYLQGPHVDLRPSLGQSRTLEDMKSIIKTIAEREGEDLDSVPAVVDAEGVPLVPSPEAVAASLAEVRPSATETEEATIDAVHPPSECASDESGGYAALVGLRSYDDVEPETIVFGVNGTASLGRIAGGKSMGSIWYMRHRKQEFADHTDAEAAAVEAAVVAAAGGSAKRAADGTVKSRSQPATVVTVATSTTAGGENSTVAAACETE